MSWHISFSNRQSVYNTCWLIPKSLGGNWSCYRKRSIYVLVDISSTSYCHYDLMVNMSKCSCFVTCPFTADLLASLGSLTKLCPLELLGGRVPEQAYFSASITVVFPEPFWPRIRVTGDVNFTSCMSSSYGPKLRMPHIWILDNCAMAKC